MRGTVKLERGTVPYFGASGEILIRIIAANRLVSVELRYAKIK